MYSRNTSPKLMIVDNAISYLIMKNKNPNKNKWKLGTDKFIDVFFKFFINT